MNLSPARHLRAQPLLPMELPQIKSIPIQEKMPDLPLDKRFSLLILPLSKIQKHPVVLYLIFLFLGWGGLSSPDGLRTGPRDFCGISEPAAAPAAGTGSMRMGQGGTEGWGQWGPPAHPAGPGLFPIHQSVFQVGSGTPSSPGQPLLAPRQSHLWLTAKNLSLPQLLIQPWLP